MNRRFRTLALLAALMSYYCAFAQNAALAPDRVSSDANSDAPKCEAAVKAAESNAGTHRPWNQNDVTAGVLARRGGTTIEDELLTKEKCRSYLLTGVRAAALYNSEVSRVSKDVKGLLSLHKARGATQTNLSYAGGVDTYASGEISNSFFHRVSASHSIYLPRWEISLGNSFDALPQSAYGTYAYGAPAPGPNQTAFAPAQKQLANIALFEVTRHTARNFDVRGVGSYSLLHFSSRNLVSYDSYVLGTGLEHTSARRSVSADYNNVLTHFSTGSDMRVNQLVARLRLRARGHLGFEVGGGINLVSFPSAVDVEERLHPVPDARITAWWNAETVLIAMSYAHHVSEGSGLIEGAASHDVQIDVARRFGRVWWAEWNVGFSNNRQIAIPEKPLGHPVAYRSTFGAARVHRAFGRSLEVFANYSYGRQLTREAPSGIAQSSDALYRRHQVSTGFTYTFSPIAIH